MTFLNCILMMHKVSHAQTLLRVTEMKLLTSRRDTRAHDSPA